MLESKKALGIQGLVFILKTVQNTKIFTDMNSAACIKHRTYGTAKVTSSLPWHK